VNRLEIIKETMEEIYEIQEDIIELDQEIQLKQDKLFELKYKLALLQGCEE
jgi:hypothetical protein